MKIAIIEKGHFEVCYTLLRLLEHPDNHITVFIDSDAATQLQPMIADQSVTWVIQEQQEPNRAFIRKIFRQLVVGNYDKCFFSTIADNFDLYGSLIKKVSPATEMMMTIHDLNGFVCKPNRWTLRTAVRWVGRRQLRPRIPSFIVLSSTMLSEAKSKLGAKPVRVVPGSIFEPDHYKPVEIKVNEPIRLVVPGSVDDRRRNYGFVLQFLKCVHDQQLPVHVTLLGAPSRRLPLNLWKEFKAYPALQLKMYEENISQAEFDQVLRNAHFIWTPLQPTSTINDGIAEQYGITTTSGNMADIIRHARPYLAPGWLTVEPALKGSGVFYQDVNAIVHLLRQLTPGSYQQMLQHAYKSSMAFTKTEVLARNPWLLARRSD